MAAIRPISELRNNFNDVATLCNEQGEAFITRKAHLFRKYGIGWHSAGDVRRAIAPLRTGLPQGHAPVYP